MEKRLIESFLTSEIIAADPEPMLKLRAITAVRRDELGVTGAFPLTRGYNSSYRRIDPPGFPPDS